MKPCWLRVSCLLSVYSLCIQIQLAVSIKLKTVKKQSTNNPPCHRGIMSLFGWCEQSDCAESCTCRSSSVCKQICGQDQCNLLNCTTNQSCFQSILLSDYINGVPHVKKMVSHSPIAQQDCSQGRCGLMKALRYKHQFTQTFQSCSEGHCEHLYSQGDHVKQFCGNCKKMTCTGEHAKNCSQLCVLGKCENMYCNARHCEQLCAHESTCNLTCGPNAQSCDQLCSHGSTCTMNCHGKNCKQTCTAAKSCTKNMLHTTQKTITTTNATTTHTPTQSKTKTILPTRISTINTKSTRLLSTRISSSTITKIVRTRTPIIVIQAYSSSVYIYLSTNCLLLTIVSIFFLS